MSTKQMLEREGFKCVTTRVRTYDGMKEHLYYNKHLGKEIIVRE